MKIRRNKNSLENFLDLHFEISFAKNQIYRKMARKGSGNPNYLGISDFIDTERTGEGMGLARNSDTRIKSPKGAVTNQPLSPFEEMQLQRNKFKM